MKICKICGKSKPLTEFYYHKGYREDRHPECRKCTYEKKRSIQSLHPEKSIQPNNINTRVCPKCGIEKTIHEFYHFKNSSGKDQSRPECKECNKKYARYWIKANPEKRKKIKHAYDVSHLPYIREQNRKWRAKNIEKSREYLRRSNAKRYATINGKLNANISSGIRDSLTGRKNGKHWEDIVGYTIYDLKKHLEKHFLAGMTWGNYGRHGWHIDHIIPMAVFNYKDSSHIDFRKCWALDNLQPLWEKDNLRKGCKIYAPFQPSLAIGVTNCVFQ